MKILKPGKVEMRKFVCEKCGCVFLASPADECYKYPEHVKCPQEGCDWYVLEHTGDPYEEPTPTQTDRERLENIIREWNWWDDGTCGFAQYLIACGVTFREEGDIDYMKYFMGKIHPAMEVID